MSESLIRYPERIRQPIDATGFDYSGDPRKKGCDIDWMSDHGGRGWTIAEAKKKGAEMPDGQRWMLEKMAKDFYKAGKPAIVLLVEHEQYDTCQPIILMDCQVAAFYMPQFGRWIKPKKQILALEATIKFIAKYIDI